MKGRRPKQRTSAPARTIEGEPPAWLDEYARETWKRTLAALKAADRSLDELDREAFLAFCQASGTIRRAAEEIARDGLTVPSERDGTKKHPALMAQSGAMAQLRMLAAELGLTAASRGRLPKGAEGKGARFPEHLLDHAPREQIEAYRRRNGRYPDNPFQLL